MIQIKYTIPHVINALSQIYIKKYREPSCSIKIFRYQVYSVEIHNTLNMKTKHGCALHFQDQKLPKILWFFVKLLKMRNFNKLGI